MLVNFNWLTNSEEREVVVLVERAWVVLLSWLLDEGLVDVLVRLLVVEVWLVTGSVIWIALGRLRATGASVLPLT
jgi:hypothetical protein